MESYQFPGKGSRVNIGDWGSIIMLLKKKVDYMLNCIYYLIPSIFTNYWNILIIHIDNVLPHISEYVSIYIYVLY